MNKNKVNLVGTLGANLVGVLFPNKNGVEEKW
jgi:hypothetical protein